MKLDERTWLIPTPKNAVPYIVALSPEAIAVFEEAQARSGQG